MSFFDVYLLSKYLIFGKFYDIINSIKDKFINMSFRHVFREKVKNEVKFMSNLIANEYKCFENIKHIRGNGTEYWSARELSYVLDYNKWENFNNVIKRAMIACENSGHDVACDFPEVRKIVKAGAMEKPVIDYELTRYACYLIVQNGDPRKEVIALGQTYFAIQTYRQEVADRFNELDEKKKILLLTLFVLQNLRKKVHL